MIRAKIYSPELADKAPATFKWAKPKWKGMEEQRYTLQVAPEDCTGCGVCVEVCPVKSKSDASKKAINMAPQAPLARAGARELGLLPRAAGSGPREALAHTSEGPAASAAALRVLGRLRGLRRNPVHQAADAVVWRPALYLQCYGLLVDLRRQPADNALHSNGQGRGPTWSNSLFEDNAEFGFGMRAALDQQKAFAENLVTRLASAIGAELAADLVGASQKTEAEINQQRERVRALRAVLDGNSSSDARNLLAIADSLVRKSVWILGGDGWAYDIGFGGLDHVLGSGKNVNVLVLDTGVYSNTGGQASKSTPRGAVAKFAASGKPNSRKDLAMEAVSYGSVYVAQVALGGNDTHVMKAFQEAEAHEGPSIIIAYSSCIAHGYDLVHGLEQQKLAVQSGYWPLMRYNPALREDGKNPFQLDSKSPSIRLKEYAYREARYTMLARSNPELAAKLLAEAQDDVERAWRVYSARAAMPGRGETPHIAPPEKPEENSEAKLAAAAAGGER